MWLSTLSLITLLVRVVLGLGPYCFGNNTGNAGFCIDGSTSEAQLCTSNGFSIEGLQNESCGGSEQVLLLPAFRVDIWPPDSKLIAACRIWEGGIPYVSTHLKLLRLAFVMISNRRRKPRFVKTTFFPSLIVNLNVRMAHRYWLFSFAFYWDAAGLLSCRNLSKPKIV